MQNYSIQMTIVGIERIFHGGTVRLCCSRQARAMDTGHRAGCHISVIVNYGLFARRALAEKNADG
jgi:hypothetical protein